ncbi:hypothetical protein EV121DRAFT_287520 [Schizophyllum commune]
MKSIFKTLPRKQTPAVHSPLSTVTTVTSPAAIELQAAPPATPISTTTGPSPSSNKPTCPPVFPAPSTTAPPPTIEPADEGRQSDVPAETALARRGAIGVSNPTPDVEEARGAQDAQMPAESSVQPDEAVATAATDLLSAISPASNAVDLLPGPQGPSAFAYPQIIGVNLPETTAAYKPTRATLADSTTGVTPTSGTPLATTGHSGGQSTSPASPGLPNVAPAASKVTTPRQINRSITAYSLSRKAFESERPGVPKTEITKMFKLLWKEMPKAERLKWDMKAAQASEAQAQASAST